MALHLAPRVRFRATVAAALAAVMTLGTAMFAPSIAIAPAAPTLTMSLIAALVTMLALLA